MNPTLKSIAVQHARTHLDNLQVVIDNLENVRRGLLRDGFVTGHLRVVTESVAQLEIIRDAARKALAIFEG